MENWEFQGRVLYHDVRQVGEGIHDNPNKVKDFDFGDKYKDFSRIHVDGKMKIEISQGKEYSTKLTGIDFSYKF